MRSYLNGKVAAPGLENQVRSLTARHPLSEKVGTNFADNRRSLSHIVLLRSKAMEFSLEAY
jgi:hypothetical protein